jgi:hypothetical protein
MPNQTLILYEFMLGGLVMACGVAGLFFLRFWRKTRDRLFLMFAISFWILGLNWLALAFIEQEEQKTILYAVRLVAFGLILFAIIDKNRAAKGTGPGA